MRRQAEVPFRRFKVTVVQPGLVGERSCTIEAYTIEQAVASIRESPWFEVATDHGGIELLHLAGARVRVTPTR